jgi:hypothetical protein
VLDGGIGTYGREDPLEQLTSVTYEGKVASGTWESDKAAKFFRKGTFRFECNGDGTAFEGKYGDGDTDQTSNWSGKRLKTPPAADKNAIAAAKLAEEEAAAAKLKVRDKSPPSRSTQPGRLRRRCRALHLSARCARQAEQDAAAMEAKLAAAEEARLAAMGEAERAKAEEAARREAEEAARKAAEAAAKQVRRGTRTTGAISI